MATIVNERARFRGGRKAVAGLATLALAVVGLGIWMQPATDQATTSVEQGVAFSPEAVRARNTAGLYTHDAVSPEAARVRNTAGLYEQEALSPELMRMRNLADLYGESFVLGSD